MSFHVQVIITKTTRDDTPVLRGRARVDGMEEGTKRDRRTDELVRVGVTKENDQEAIVAAIRLLQTMAGVTS